MTEEAGEETEIGEASELPRKCTRQNVLIAVLKPKYLSNLIRKDRFTAENVFRNIENQDKTDINYYLLTEFISTLISFPFLKVNLIWSISFLSSWFLHIYKEPFAGSF
jgi:hypothetical protein